MLSLERKIVSKFIKTRGRDGYKINRIFQGMKLISVWLLSMWSFLKEKLRKTFIIMCSVMNKWIKFEGIIIVIVVTHSCSYRIRCNFGIFNVYKNNWTNERGWKTKDKCKGMDSSRGVHGKCVKKKKKRNRGKQKIYNHESVTFPFWWTADVVYWISRVQRNSAIIYSGFRFHFISLSRLILARQIF